MSALALGLIVGRVPAGAQERAGARESWPSRPLTMVVPFAAGGPVDLLGRIVGQYLGAQLGTAAVIGEFLRAGGMPPPQRAPPPPPGALPLPPRAAPPPPRHPHPLHPPPH